MNFRLFALNVAIPALSFALFPSGTHAQTAPGPTLSKEFVPSTIGPGSTSKLTFTISNESAAPVTDLVFTDTLPPGVTIAEGGGAVSGCGGTLTAPDGGSTITLTDGSVSGSEDCEICVNVVGAAPPEGSVVTYTNTSSILQSSVGPGTSATADLIVRTDRPGFSKSFSTSPVAFGQRITLTFTIDNTLNAAAASNLVFSDALPLGVTIASPANATNGCGGTLTAAPGSGQIRYSGNGILGAGSDCAISVDVVAGQVGVLTNTSSELTSSASPGGASRSSGLASASLQVTNDPILLTKNFLNDPVGPGGTVDLQFTLFNVTRFDATNIAFTDDLEAALPGLVSTGVVENGCDGSTVSGTDSLSFSGGTLYGSNGLVDPVRPSSCSFTVRLAVPTTALGGLHPNATSTITADINGSAASGAAAEDLLAVQTTVLSKSFDPVIVGPGGSTTLEFTLTNFSDSAATAISFSDNLAQFIGGLTVTDLPTTGFCGPASALSFQEFDGELVFSGGSLDPGASCTFSVDLLLPEGGVSGTFVNRVDDVLSTVNGTTAVGPSASAELTVARAPTLVKEFDGPVAPGGTGRLTFTISLEDDAAGGVTDIAFTDDLDAALSGLTVTTGLPLDDVCGTDSQLGGTPGNLSLTGGSLSAGETCSFSVDVLVPDTLPGTYTNTTSTLTAESDGVAVISAAAKADLLVTGLTLTKEFIDDPVTPGQNTTLEFTLTNSHPSEAASNISFTDSLDETLELLESVSGPVADVCGAGSQIAGNSVLVFSGGSLAADSSCTFSVTVAVPAGASAGSYPNRTSTVSAMIAGATVIVPGASALLVIGEPEEEVEETFPTVTVEQAVGQPDPTNTQPILFTAVFSEPVKGFGNDFETGDPTVSVVPGFGVPIILVSETGPLDGTTFEISVDGLTTEGLVTVDIPAGVANGEFFPNQASSSGDNSVLFSASRGDLTPPVITLNGSATVTVECTAPYVDAGATATDEIDPNVEVIVGGDHPIDTSVPGTYVITYDATDAAGNNAVQVTRTVTVEDTIPPIITLVGLASLTLECGIETYVEEGATATDLCEGDVPVTIGGDAVNTLVPGVYVVTYDAHDSVPNDANQVTRTVTVEDTTPPSIELVGEPLVCVVQGETYLEPVPGALATDACDDPEDPGDDPVVTPGDANPINTSALGDIVVTYTATDNVGLTAQVSRTIRVIPRFATVEGVFATNDVDLKQSSLVTGGGEKTRHLVASQKDVKLEDAAVVHGNVVSVTGGTDMKKNSVIDGNLDSGSDVTLHDDASVGGDVTSNDKKVELKKNAAVAGSIEADGDVTLHDAASVGFDVTSGENVELKKDASVGGAVKAGGTVKLHATASVGSFTENAAVSPLPPLPGIPLPTLALAAGGADVTVPDNGTLTLGAGIHGELDVGKNATLTLSPAGIYHFNSIKVEENTTIIVGGAATINVVGNLEFKPGVQMSGAAASEILFQCDGNSVKLGSKVGQVSVLRGTYLAPNADIKLEKAASLTGALFGHKTTVESGATVTGMIALDPIMAASAGWGPLVLPLRREPAMAYEEWANSYGIIDESADVDHDGFINAVEYLLSSDPFEVDAAPAPLIDVSDQVVSWSIPLREGLEMNTLSTVPVIEVSLDLIRWNRPETVGLLQTLDNDLLEVSGPLPSRSMYFRIGMEPQQIADPIGEGQDGDTNPSAPSSAPPATPGLQSPSPAPVVDDQLDQGDDPAQPTPGPVTTPASSSGGSLSNGRD